MAYIRGEGKPADASDVGCPFCTAPGKDDRTALIVYRGGTCFVLIDLFPYNSGHLLTCAPSSSPALRSSPTRNAWAGQPDGDGHARHARGCIPGRLIWG